MNGLCTDLYEVRMAATYRRRRMTGPATFSLFCRRLPAGRGFLVAAGLDDVLGFLEQFCMEDAELSYLHGAADIDLPSLATLRGLRFTGDVWAVPEGHVVFAGEPLLEVTGDAAEAQLVETAVLNLVTFQTTVASKAARCRLAARGARLADFSMRRTHGLDAAVSVARAARIGGFDATSNVEAARRYGLRPAGTMAHSFVQAFGDERAAFRAFARDHPEDPVFLVDTYDTAGGVRAAIDVLRHTGPAGPAGVRLDSGDLGVLAVRVRAMLDDAGLPHVRIVASGGLDEYRIAELVARGAPIDVYGVGTRMGVSWDAPSLDSAYKLVAFAGRPVCKLSPGKATLPGAKQIFRDPAGTAADVLALRDEPVPAGRHALLEPVMRRGHRLRHESPADGVAAAASRCERDLGRLPPSALAIADSVPPDVRVSRALAALRDRLADGHRRGFTGTPCR
jgi:nicotinate phosphoribosyltransferase